MLLLISPAKTLDESNMTRSVAATQPRFLREAETLVSVLRDYTPEQLGELMGISDKLATLNVARYRDFSMPLDDGNAKPALFSFKGDVYVPIGVADYDDDALAFAQCHLRILSGLYGLLWPLDYLYPYRLEMGTKLHTDAGNTLYDFWGDTITEALNQDPEGEVVINLASSEYSKAIRSNTLSGRFLTVDFKERKGDDYKIIGIHAKKARGMMVDYVIRHRLNEPEALKDFDSAGYQYASSLSNENHYIFTRG